MYINVTDLHNLLYNILLWTPGKAEAKKYSSGGLVKVASSSNAISLLSTDGYVVVESGIACNRESHFVRGEDIKRILQYLPSVESEEVEVNFSEEKWFFGTEWIETVSSGIDWDFWNSIYEIAAIIPERSVSKDYSTPEKLSLLAPFEKFYLQPKRLQKFSLVEPRGEYPLAFQILQTKFDQPVLGWKYGPGLRGVMAPLVAEALVEAYPDDDGTILW